MQTNGSITMLIPAPYNDMHFTFISSLCKSKYTSLAHGNGLNVRGQCKDGSLVPVHVSATKVRVGDNSEEISLIVHIQGKSLIPMRFCDFEILTICSGTVITHQLQICHTT